QWSPVVGVIIPSVFVPGGGLSAGAICGRRWVRHPRRPAGAGRGRRGDARPATMLEMHFVLRCSLGQRSGYRCLRDGGGATTMLQRAREEG
ncbi:unnamed protein product, partial [Ectocarpus sp. 12 AP-2014]